MSSHELRETHRRDCFELASGKAGQLVCADRIARRGKGGEATVVRSYQAIFTYDEPVFCDEDSVPLRAGYFPLEDGKAEITQMIGRFMTARDRATWMEQTFSS